MFYEFFLEVMIHNLKNDKFKNEIELKKRSLEFFDFLVSEF